MAVGQLVECPSGEHSVELNPRGGLDQLTGSCHGLIMVPMAVDPADRAVQRSSGGHLAGPPVRGMDVGAPRPAGTRRATEHPVETG
jgi:hypothetical protein